jgi:hypothetical protein
MQELVELVKAEMAAETERSGYSIPFRIYMSKIAPPWQMAIEWEYENLAEYDKAWAEWGARPTTAEFWMKWFEMTEPGGANDIWELAE